MTPANSLAASAHLPGFQHRRLRWQAAPFESATRYSPFAPFRSFASVSVGSFASWAKLGEKLKLPKGWRTRDLSDDLVLDLKSDETIYAIGDEYHQYWTRIPNYKANKS